jgi:hypothetical protein
MAKHVKPGKDGSPKKDAKPRGRPRQQDLPGTEDRAIKPLEDVAAAYADVRDRRMVLNKEEHELKVHALKLMHKYGKTIYRRDGIEIRIVESDEDVKVKILKPGDDESTHEGDDEAIDEPLTRNGV